MGIRMLPLAATLVATLMLAGCVPSAPVVTPAPESSVAPIFATDEDALAAATEAYRKYLEVVDASLSDYVLDNLSDHAEGIALESAISMANSYKSLGNHQTGQVVVIRTEPTDLEPVLRPDARNLPVQIYACIDLSSVDVLDSSGKSIVASNRPDQIYQLVSLAWHSDKSTFKVIDDEVWANEC